MKKITKIVFLILLVAVLVVCGYFLFFNVYDGAKKNVNLSPNTSLVGGCGGVYYIYWNDCCDSWAKENNVVKAQCVGNWTVEDNVCEWNCA